MSQSVTYSANATKFGQSIGGLVANSAITNADGTFLNHPGIGSPGSVHYEYGGFDLSAIPANVISIDGIAFSVKGYSLNGTLFYRGFLDNNNGSSGGTLTGGTSPVNNVTIPATNQVTTLGDANNKWGVTGISRAALQDPGFCLGIIYANYGEYGGDAYIDQVRITVYAQIPSPAPIVFLVDPFGSPITAGQPITLMAIVAAANPDPTGTITFKDGGSSIGTGSLSLVTSGIYSGYQMATLTTTLTAGSHTLNCSYGGDGNWSSANGTSDRTGTVVAASGGRSFMFVRPMFPEGY